MKDLAFLGSFISVVFVAFFVYWNGRWKGKFLDERETVIRLRVRELISRGIEITLVSAIAFHFLIRPLTGMEALMLVGLAGVLSEAFGNWYFRREDSASVE